MPIERTTAWVEGLLVEMNRTRCVGIFAGNAISSGSQREPHCSLSSSVIKGNKMQQQQSQGIKDSQGHLGGSGEWERQED